MSARDELVERLAKIITVWHFPLLRDDVVRSDIAHAGRSAAAAVLDALDPDADAQAAVERVQRAISDLAELTEGPLRIGTALWPECDRDAYSLAIEEAQTQLRAALAGPDTDGGLS